VGDRQLYQSPLIRLARFAAISCVFGARAAEPDISPQTPKYPEANFPLRPRPVAAIEGLCLPRIDMVKVCLTRNKV
jgi:hypothetical protein